MARAHDKIRHDKLIGPAQESFELFTTDTAPNARKRIRLEQPRLGHKTRIQGSDCSRHAHINSRISSYTLVQLGEDFSTCAISLIILYIVELFWQQYQQEFFSRKLKVYFFFIFSRGIIIISVFFADCSYISN